MAPPIWLSWRSRFSAIDHRGLLGLDHPPGAGGQTGRSQETPRYRPFRSVSTSTATLVTAAGTFAGSSQACLSTHSQSADRPKPRAQTHTATPSRHLEWGRSSPSAPRAPSPRRHTFHAWFGKLPRVALSPTVSSREFLIAAAEGGPVARRAWVGPARSPWGCCRPPLSSREFLVNDSIKVTGINTLYCTFGQYQVLIDSTVGSFYLYDL